MPLNKTIKVNPHTKVFIWKITEPLEELKKGIELTENCKKRIAGMKSEIHQKGFVSVRQLLKVAGYTSSDLFYVNDKPYLKDGKHISITHSFIFSAIIVSDEETGIDIEKQREKIKAIAPKFINNEFDFLTEKDIVKKLTVIWCVKESLYKLFGEKGLSFKQHIKVFPFQFKEGKAESIVHYKNKMHHHHLSFLEFDGFTCAYTAQKIYKVKP